MSDTFYPLTLPGLTWPIERIAVWKPSMKHESLSGRESRIGFELYNRWEWILQYDHLREMPSIPAADAQALWQLFNSLGGDLDTFLFSDPDENAVTNQQFGVGDGTTTTYVLTRTWAGLAEPVGYAVPSAVTVNGSGASYTLTDNRTVTFASAPANAAVLRWTGTYAYRVRFVEPEMNLKKWCAIYWKGESIRIRSVKE